MRGERIAALRERSPASAARPQRRRRFYRFYRGERFTVIRFGGTILGEQDFTVNGPADLAALRDWLATDSFDNATAVWSALDYAYSTVGGDDPQRKVSIVLMTDGENNAGVGLAEFLTHPDRPCRRSPSATARPTGPSWTRWRPRPAGCPSIANTLSLLNAFKEIRGC
jgi:Ca-activated chloride channel family protein